MSFFFFFPPISKYTIEADHNLLAGSLGRAKQKNNKLSLHSYNWCSADYCEGGAAKGTCDLKTWDTSKPGEIWGCSGAGQLWKVRVLVFF